MLARSGLAVLALLSTVLAGCAGGGGGDPVDDVPTLDVTSTTGGIRGVVVDDSIRPIKGATVEIVSTGESVSTDETGLFAFSDLEAGQYFVKASHPLYDVQQQTTEVVAGVADPLPVKFLLKRLINADPYLTIEKFDGYIVCSAGHPEVGYSEECGEGVGVPGVGRVGGQANNQVQYDFYADNLDVKTILVELDWENTAQTAASGELLTYVSTKWVCDPFCSGNTFVRGGSGTPLILRADNVDGKLTAVTECSGCDAVELEEGEPITVFTWANPTVYDPATGTVPVGSVMVNQPYQEFVVKSYYLPLPEGWSFVNGDVNPFA